jgi:hypothetical protein
MLMQDPLGGSESVLPTHHYFSTIHTSRQISLALVDESCNSSCSLIGYGQRPCRVPHQQAEHMAAPTSQASSIKKILANTEPSTHGTRETFPGHSIYVSNAA